MDTETSKEYEYKLIDQKLIDIYKKDTITIYGNDLKYKNHNQIDIKRVKDSNNNINYDTIEYRLNECIKTGSTSLDFSHLNLKVLPEIPKIVWNKLKYLFISENEIQVVEDISYLKELIVFDICNNKLISMPLLPERIEEILIKNNDIHNINSLSRYDYLKRLDCTNNLIINIPIIDSLEILNCNSNKIKYIPNLKNLVKLSCSDNKLTELCNFCKLEILDCDKNNINKIDNNVNLKELYCCRNEITHIKNLNKIEVLHCYRTNIKKMDYFETLKELICDDKSDFIISSFYTIASSDTYENKIMVIHFK